MRKVLLSGMSALVLLTAARQAVQAIQNHDEQALFEAGNEALYPPCKNCHATYLPR